MVSVVYKALAAKSAADATGIGYAPAEHLPSAQELSAYVEFSAGAAAGTVLIEGASSNAYAGTWAVLGTVAWAAASKAHIVQITGCHLALRARISGAVTGGTVDVTFVIKK
jgi:hypothetical protein